MVKKLFFVGIFLFQCLYLISQLNQITFQVDLNNEVISPHGVHIAGDFQSVAGLGGNWSPSSTEMVDNNGDGIYSIVVLIPDNTYEYKFINGNAWGMDESPPGECTVGPTHNRSFSVSGSNFTLPAVPFHGCLPIVNFSVNNKSQD